MRKAISAHNTLKDQFYKCKTERERLEYLTRFVGYNIVHCLNKEINLNYIRMLVLYLKKYHKFTKKLSITTIAEKIIEVALEKYSEAHGTRAVYVE